MAKMILGGVGMEKRMYKKASLCSQVTEGEVKKSEIAGHAIAGVGQNLIFGIWSSYMLMFFTDVFGIAAGAAAIIMTLTRIWDGVNDPMMGAVADRTRTRWGRYRPWLLFMAGPIVVFLVLSFSTPNLSQGGKLAWAAVTYVCMSMAFTAVDVSYWTMPAAMSCNVGSRTTIISASKATTSIAATAVGIAVIPLVTLLGKGDMAKGFRLTALVIGVTGAVFYLTGFKMIREHVTPPQIEKVGFKKAMEVITQNRPLLLVLICALLSNVGLLLRQNLAPYYVQYNIGSLDLMPLFSLIMLPGMMLGVIAAPVLAKKLGQKRLYIVASVFGIVVNGLFFSVGYSNLTAVLVLYGLSSLPTGTTVVLIGSMIANTIEYAEWMTGQRREGLISSTQTFVAKLGLAAGAGLSGIVLMAANYVPNVEQTKETLSIFHGSFTIVVMVLWFVGIIPMLFNNLTDEKHAQIVVELEERRKKQKE